MANHKLSDDDFRELAAGFGSAAAVGQLIEAQRTLRRALLGAVYRAGITAPAVTGPMRETLGTAWIILAAADRERPEALDRVLAHPYVRVWAARCLEQAGLAGPAGESDPVHRPAAAAGLGHLAAIAAATVIRAGGQADITVPVTRGAVHLPTLGRLVVSAVDSGPQPREAVLSADGKSASIRIGRDSWEFTTADLLSGEPRAAETFGDGGSAAWQPVRTLSAAGISVALEDTDPYRDCHRWPAAARLTEAEAAQWQHRFADAWQEIARDHPAYAPAIAAGLAVLMPMAPAPQGRDVSATARHAFGAIGAALPADATTLALLIMHEFQHVKLGAILDLYDLYDPADRELYYAPWREDMRPLEGLLQGTYAHLAVCEYWRTRQKVTSGAEAQAAGERFAFWHAHTREAVETLANSGSMTPLGMRFIEAMRAGAGNTRVRCDGD